jgi:hypothetical protein
MKNIAITFSLIGLYYAIEHDYTGKQVQRVHMLLAQPKNNWPTLPLPNKPYSLTVSDVLKEKPGRNRDDMLQEWVGVLGTSTQLGSGHFTNFVEIDSLLRSNL